LVFYSEFQNRKYRKGVSGNPKSKKAVPATKIC